MITKTGKDIKYAARLLRDGYVVAIPTETVYGLAANALDKQAIEKVFEAKGRPKSNPLIVHVASKEKVNDYVGKFPSLAKKLADKFWPGPLTLLLPKKALIPDAVTAGLPNVAVRVPSHPLTLELLHGLPFPLVAPSANPFGYISPTSATHVVNQLAGKVPYVLDGGECQRGIESTVIGFEGESPVVYRLGTVSIEEIEAVVGKVKILIKESPVLKSPGMLRQHYAPRTPLIIVDSIESYLATHDSSKTGVISLDKKYGGVPGTHQVMLSETGNFTEAAKKLYGALHFLDEKNLEVIISERFPEEDLGKTINDRLQRASHRD